MTTEAHSLDEAFVDPDFDDSDWPCIDLPNHWVLPPGRGWGSPIYTNVAYPIPLDPPHTPDENPTMDHRRTFTVPPAWLRSGRVHLRTDGIESHARIWINGTFAGERLGSRLVHEMDISDLVVPGLNHVAIRVHQWSVGTYLEDQDHWWLPGIFREVRLLHRPEGCLDDVTVRAAYDNETATGKLTVVVRADSSAWPVDVVIDELEIRVTALTPGDPLEVSLPCAEPWSDEAPRLYEVVVTSSGEQVRVRTGFRTVDVQDGVLRANGRPLQIRGVNRHESDPHVGRVFDAARVREDLLMIKRFNGNAIRTAHYPPHPGVLDLADEIGLWVMLECDLETHGFELEGWRRNPSADPGWREHYLDRIERTVERDKNHPSIFSWSLGNESGRGSNLADMAEWVRRRDPDRLVHYEGDHQAAYTQIYSRMYPALEEVEAFLHKNGPLAAPHHPASEVTAAQAARARQLPYLLVEYLHAMGTGAGGAADYARVIASDPRVCGGFVWEWRDHSLWTTTSDGAPYLGYGGDFGEVVHDGNFVADGLVSAEGIASSGLIEWSHTVAPVRAAWVGGGVEVTSQLQHTSTSDLDVFWRLESDGVVCASGAVGVQALEPATTRWQPGPVAIGAALRAAPPGEVWLTLEVRVIRDLPYAARGHLVSRSQAQLMTSPTVTAPQVHTQPEQPEDSDAAGHLDSGERTLQVGPVMVDRLTGRVSRVGDLMVADAGLETWRAPTDNDCGHGPLDYTDVDPESSLGAGSGRWGPSSAERWRAAGLDRMVPRVVEARSGPTHCFVATRWAAAGLSVGVRCEVRWEAPDPGRARLSVRVRPEPGWSGTWPRMGLRWVLPLADWSVEWFGAGPGESYPDLREATHVARHRRAMAALVERHVRPQESGHRSDVRWLRLSRDDAPGLEIRRVSGTLGFGVGAWSPGELSAVTHPHQLPESSGAHLTLDLAQHGLGSRSCGPDVRPDSALRPRELTATIDISVAT